MERKSQENRLKKRGGQTALEYAMVLGAIILPLAAAFMMIQGDKSHEGIFRPAYLSAVGGRVSPTQETLGAISAPYP